MRRSSGHITIGVLALCLSVSHCTQNSRHGSEVEPEPGCREVQASCHELNPSCWDQPFHCCEEDGVHICDVDAAPDDGSWDCWEERNILICHGELVVDEGWHCWALTAGIFECTRHAFYPSNPSGSRWGCAYEDAQRICRSDRMPVDGGDGDGDGDIDPDLDCPPGVDSPSPETMGDGIDNDCDGLVDECDADCLVSGCLCRPLSWRFCDTWSYGRWGMQQCSEDGLSWDICMELGPGEVPSPCLDLEGEYTSAAEACCIELGRCCQDTWDLDGDGDRFESLPSGCPEAECVEVP